MGIEELFVALFEAKFVSSLVYGIEEEHCEMETFFGVIPSIWGLKKIFTHTSGSACLLLVYGDWSTSELIQYSAERLPLVYGDWRWEGDWSFKFNGFPLMYGDWKD